MRYVKLQIKTKVITTQTIVHINENKQNILIAIKAQNFILNSRTRNLQYGP